MSGHWAAFRELKKTRCGTPRYMAPEVLEKEGYSYEVDVWSLGCILYTLLVGKSPFAKQTQKDTYNTIRKNEYNVPSEVGPLAKSQIKKLLQCNQRKRPKIMKILLDDFMTTSYLPPHLPMSCLVTAPRFDTNLSSEFNAQSRGEVRAARERAVVPLEQRMTKFRQLLEDKKISAFSTWKKEHKIEFDSRYLLLTSEERKQVFYKYVKDVKKMRWTRPTQPPAPQTVCCMCGYQAERGSGRESLCYIMYSHYAAAHFNAQLGAYIGSDGTCLVYHRSRGAGSCWGGNWRWRTTSWMICCRSSGA
jgi:serine/threonine protein kinase